MNSTRTRMIKGRRKDHKESPLWGIKANLKYISKQDYFKSFMMGLLIGLIFFFGLYGFSIVDPFSTDWIWNIATHDTAQHQLGWEFYRATGSGSTITGLAAPYGLSMVFMDVIPLMAIKFKLLSFMLPTNFQYFGLWIVLCYALMGGLAGVIMSRIWNKFSNKNETWRNLFVASGSLIFVVSPMMIARSFYHSALAGQWIIMLAILLVIDAKKNYSNKKFISIWSLMMVLAILIHPYFLPMTGVMMLIAIIRRYQILKFAKKQPLIVTAASITIPIISSLVVFYLLGGFSLGSGAEVYDLPEKGFDLLSFWNPRGYSLLPQFASSSTSPESMMWLGLGTIVAGVLAIWYWRGAYKEQLLKAYDYCKNHKNEVVLITLTIFGLLVFAIGNRIAAGPIVLAEYHVPHLIYKIWSAFRAASREAWPLYYALTILIIYSLIAGKSRRLRMAKKSTDGIAITLAILMSVIGIIQLVDIRYSNQVQNKHQIITATYNSNVTDFKPLNLDKIIKKQKHLVVLDHNFRGDQRSFYILGQTAVKYNLSLNSGYFARIPSNVYRDQDKWTDRIKKGNIDNNEFKYNIFATRNLSIVKEIKDKYLLSRSGGWWFIYQRK